MTQNQRNLVGKTGKAKVIDVNLDGVSKHAYAARSI